MRHQDGFPSSGTVFASWNGATEVSSWRVVAGPSADEVVEGGAGPRDGFEAAIEVTTAEPRVAVEALDVDGGVLGVFEPIGA